MSQLGVGVMINMLFGGGENPEKYFGKTIQAVEFSEDGIILTLDHGLKIKVSDEGQSCCEHRYMRTDDDPQSLVGQTLTRIDVKDVDGDREVEEDDYGVHEICFLEIGTDKGCISISTHNEHNGYYGGFSLMVQELEKGDDSCVVS